MGPYCRRMPRVPNGHSSIRQQARLELLRNTFVKRAIDAATRTNATADKYMTGGFRGRLHACASSGSSRLI